MATSSGNMVTDLDMIKGISYNYFCRIFTNDCRMSDIKLLEGKFPKLCNNVWEKINAPFAADKIKKTLFDMSPFKAQGRCGYHAGCFQKA